MGLTLGIDLGTTYSSAAFIANGEVRLVADERGEVCFPSVVHYPAEGLPLVGTAACRARVMDAAHTVSGVKRLLGQSVDSPSARLFEAMCACRMVPDKQGGAALMFRGRVRSAIAVAADLIAYLKDRAEQTAGRPIQRALITVPVSASLRARNATEAAARMAGFTFVSSAYEPLAGAIASNVGVEAGDRRFMVYDFGGGTFDVCVVEQREHRFFMRAMGGDACLGGDDFDEQLVRQVARDVWARHRIELHHDVIRLERIQRKCEQVKRALSVSMVARLKLEDAYSHEDEAIGIDRRFHRDEVELLWSDLVERSIVLGARTLVDAQMRPTDLSDVVLIGGTTHIPMVKREVARVFQRPIRQHDDPQTTVAIGAAILGAQPDAVGVDAPDCFLASA